MIIQQFLSRVESRNELQKKALSKVLANLSIEEKDKLEQVLEYYIEKYGFDYTVESYLILIEDTLRETKYFVEHGHYRCSTFEEVSQNVYFNDDYMSKYMLGLAISGYLWTTHLKMHRNFVTILAQVKEGNQYLEIGPGHGQHFLEAVNTQKFNNYLGIDLSPASVKNTIDFVERFVKKDEKHNYQVLCKDFFELENEDQFDMIVMGEVLEHVEKPQKLLQKLYQVLSENGRAYITVPVNAPAIDHIYLFRTVEEVKDMVCQCGFKIIDTYIVTANEVPLEKVIKKRMVIDVALLIQK